MTLFCNAPVPYHCLRCLPRKHISHNCRRFCKSIWLYNKNTRSCSSFENFNEIPVLFNMVKYHRTNHKMSHCLRKPTKCLGENKSADQLRGNREADQRICFRYTDSTISLLPKSKIGSLYLSSVAVQPGLRQTWSESQIAGFLTRMLK